MARGVPLTTEEFIRRAKAAHGDKYDYSKVEYFKKYLPVTIICPVHGEFEQRPDNHSQGKGCPACARDEKAKRWADGERTREVEAQLATLRDANEWNEQLIQQLKAELSSSEVDAKMARRAAILTQQALSLAMKIITTECDYAKFKPESRANLKEIDDRIEQVLATSSKALDMIETNLALLNKPVASPTNQNQGDNNV